MSHHTALYQVLTGGVIFYHFFFFLNQQTTCNMLEELWSHKTDLYQFQFGFSEFSKVICEIGMLSVRFNDPVWAEQNKHALDFTLFSSQ